MARTNPRFNTVAVAIMAALALGFASSFFALNLSSNQAYADATQGQSALGSTQITPALNITLTPQSSSNTVGDQHDLTATVTSATTGSTPARDIAVTFQVISGPTTGVTGSATTDVYGEAFFSYTGNSVGLDTIRACFDDTNAGQVCDLATKEWVAASALLAIDLTPASATNTVGDQHDLTATVTSATTGSETAAGIAVTFQVISGPTTGVTSSSTTDPQGKAFFSYTGANTGQDTIQACFSDTNAGQVCDLATKEWVAASALLAIDLSPASATNTVGDQHDLTAIVTSATTGSETAAGIAVTFQVISGPTTGVTGSDTTDPQGEAFFSYTGNSAGQDTIQACFSDASAGQVCDTATKEWVSTSALLAIDLTPASATNTVGDQHDLTATVTSATTGSETAAGIAVTFQVISGPTSGVTGSSTTDPQGKAFFSYTGTSAGQDTIEACFNDADAGQVCDLATKEWVTVAPPPSGNSCQGEDSCRGKNISIGENSCNAEDACNGNDIVVGDNSCNEEKSCRGNSSVIGDNSCNGEEACRSNRINVGDGSCNEEESCRGNRNNIGNNSCNGEESCRGNRNNIGNNSCNGEDACRINNTTIPNDSCNEEDACSGKPDNRGRRQEEQDQEEEEEEDEQEISSESESNSSNNDSSNSDLSNSDSSSEGGSGNS